MLQYKIPQDVGVADKIVGPLTLRQLIIVAIGGGLSYVLFAIAGKLYELNILEYIIIALPALIALAAAFIKINGIPFIQFILLGLEYAIKPKKRMWDHSGISAIVAPDLGEIKAEAKKALTGTEKKARKDINLEDLSRVLDSGGFEHVKEIKHEKIDQASDDDLMIEAFFGHKAGTSENMWARTAKDKTAYDRKLKLLSSLPKTEVKALKEMKEQIAKLKKQEVMPGQKTIPQIKKEDVKTPPQMQKIVPAETIAEVKEKPFLKPQPVPQAKEKPPFVQPSVQPKSFPPAQAVQPAKKKKRRRKKKPKSAQSIRPETQVNTTQKKQPAKFMPNNQQKSTPPQQKQKPEVPEKKQTAENRGGEIHLEELKKGEIEFNLD